jgi:hypothetical protein
MAMGLWTIGEVVDMVVGKTEIITSQIVEAFLLHRIIRQGEAVVKWDDQDLGRLEVSTRIPEVEEEVEVEEASEEANTKVQAKEIIREHTIMNLLEKVRVFHIRLRLQLIRMRVLKDRALITVEMRSTTKAEAPEIVFLIN